MNTKKKENFTVSVSPVASVAVGEIQDFILRGPTNNADAAKLLQEAQDNLKFATETGHTPELSRNFNIWSLLGVGFALTNSWFGISASLITGISSGGPMVIVYGIIIIASISLGIGATLSELTSAMPSAAGQIYWTMKLAPKKYAPILSYLCGAFAWAGSVFTSASVTLSIASAVMGMYVLGTGDPNKTPQTWQVFVTFELINLFILLFNIWEKPLPTISTISMYTSIFSFIIVSITVLATSSGNYATAKFVFVDFNNATGWKSSGLAFIIGLINPNWSFSCLDSVTHMAEEIVSPETQIPKAIMLTVVLGFITAFSYAIAMFFCITDLDQILNSNTGVPILDIFYQALGNRAGAICLEILIVFTAIGCNIACHTWQARLCWSFSRENGLPGSRYWSKINPRTKQPVNAHLMSTAWCAVIGCIYMGSTTAYNAMVTACITFSLISYIFPVVCLWIKGRDNIVHGPFWLGKFGYFTNFILLFWACFAMVVYSFPPIMPVTAGNMNYVSVVIFVFGIYALVYWFCRGKYRFRTVTDDTVADPELTQQLSSQVEQLEVILSHQKSRADKY
ncbi:choline transport protein [[Candida] anglica]|uniref:Choline transport protein n=1 Tax=[Candida] anglica TaxID=148631 RepID=A0ABP0EG80_9ASCO